MTEWVVLIPAGDTAHTYEADVASPQIAPYQHADRMIRRLALERELAELRAEEGYDDTPTMPAPGLGLVYPEDVRVPMDPLESAPMPVATVDAGVPGPEVVDRIGADGIIRRERMTSYSVPGPRFSCFCEQVFHDRDLFAAHARTCARYAGATRVGGAQHEPGSFKWGVVSAK